MRRAAAARSALPLALISRAVRQRGSAANLIVAFDAGFQGGDTFSLNGKTLTFTSAIPSGIQKVYVKGFLMPQ
jgi:hypothetical protein